MQDILHHYPWIILWEIDENVEKRNVKDSEKEFLDPYTDPYQHFMDSFLNQYHILPPSFMEIGNSPFLDRPAKNQTNKTGTERAHILAQAHRGNPATNKQLQMKT